MPTYVPYRDDVETIAPDEAETHGKIIEVMTYGQNVTREKYGKAVRISHAKAHAFLRGELTINKGLPPELAQGLFATPGTHPVIVRLATAPGELLDDSKVSTDRGIAIKVFGVEGTKLPPFEDITNQDFVFETGKQFFCSGVKAFLQQFKPNAEVATHLSDTTKGIVSDVARVTNAALNAVGLNSEKLGFFGHQKKHPMAEAYYSQTPFRYGNYVAKFGVVPVTPGLQELEAMPFDPQTPNALREATVAFFQTHGAVFDFQVQLNTDLETMPVEDAQAPWSEEQSPYRTVACITLPAQDAYNPGANDAEDNLSFSPVHSLAAHRPLGAINRARLVVYTAMASLRRRENNRLNTEPANIDAAV